MIRTKIAAASLVVAGLVAGIAGPASAWDCYNTSRSTQGNTQAAQNSGNWWSIPEFLAALEGFTPDQIAAVMAVVDADPRIPADFTVYFNPAHPGELASNMNEKNATNGKGIDHSEDDGVLTAILEDVDSALGA